MLDERQNGLLRDILDSGTESKVESSAWHADALRHAEGQVKAGNARFCDWNEAKERIGRIVLA